LPGAVDAAAVLRSAGIQRPLEHIAKMTNSVYLPRGVDVHALDRSKRWPFQPANFKVGDQITGGDIFGQVCATRPRRVLQRSAHLDACAPRLMA
jgi:vacuolar-type H+-ATPase catalytic subunit A/Vma1